MIRTYQKLSISVYENISKYVIDFQFWFKTSRTTVTKSVFTAEHTKGL